MKRLYVETNFLMSICTGRTTRAAEILAQGDNVELAIPAVSFMEAHKMFSNLKRAKTSFGDSLDVEKPFASQIQDIARDPGTHAQELKQSLESSQKSLAAAGAALTSCLDESEQRLVDAISQTLERATVVSASKFVLGRVRHSYMSEAAESEPCEETCFVSEDTDFGQPTLVDAMRRAGIERLEEIEECLRWLAKP